MRPTSFSLLFLGFLSLLMGCSGAAGTGSGNNASITVHASFQKEVLTPSGSYSLVTLPARYCLVTFVDTSTNTAVGDSGYLDGTGSGTFRVPTGANVQAAVAADWAVPGTASGSPAFMKGYTVNATYPTAFNSTADWFVTSATFTATSGTLSVTALDDSNRVAGAFNIADQGVTFALGMRSLIATSSLPSVAIYWSTSITPSDQWRAYPDAYHSGSLVTIDGRAVLQGAVMGNASGAANTEQDEWDDGVLGETYAHLLFAPYTFKADGSSPLSYLRADTENVPFISLTVPSEPSQAFIAGYSDFLSAAFRGNPQILDSYRNGSGTLTVQNEDLSVPNNTLGEFSRKGVAGSLWSVWQALGGGQSGLQALWDTTQTVNSGLDSVGDYNGSPLGCFPTYLVGLRTAVGSSWPACQTAFSAWGVTDPTALYFSSGSALWTNESVPFSITGATLITPASNSSKAIQYLSYDHSGSALYRFTQGSSGTRTITLTPNGQDFELDLIGPNGPLAFNYLAPFGNARTLTQTLSPGDYVIRVRVNPDNTLVRSAGSYSYNLTLN